ncbi:MAG: hypothetical protein QM713_04325 [Arachnia sp.]
MIIWRGAGILAVLFFMAAGIFGMGLPYAIWGVAGKWALIPVALAAGAGCWFTGRYLNVIKPQRIAEQTVPAFRDQVLRSVEDGTFRLPNQPPPTSYAEAQGQAAAYLQVHIPTMLRAKNQNTLFWIPIEYWGIVIAVWGVVMPIVLH